MKLLLDTHVFLWWLADNPRLKAKVREALSSPASEVFVSAASVWEIAIKASLGRLKWPGTTDPPQSIAACHFVEAAVTARHAWAVRALPLHHTDPFDRLLVAQALTDGLFIVTADPAFAPYGVEILAA